MLLIDEINLDPRPLTPQEKELQDAIEDQLEKLNKRGIKRFYTDRNTARKEGEMYYYPQRFCINKHVSAHYVSSGECLSCIKEKSKGPNLYGTKRATTEEECIHVLVGTAKSRAKSRKIDFNISVDDLKPFPKTCPILGVKLDYVGEKRKDRATSPSLDRVRNNEGYIKGNVRIISYKANAMKSNHTVESLQKFIDYINESN